MKKRKAILPEMGCLKLSSEHFLNVEKTVQGFMKVAEKSGVGSMDCYFDDFAITHTKSPIIEEQFYYPYGLKTSNSYSRENSLENKYLYNGKELQTELDLEWYDYIARQYDPATGRFFNVDPLAEDYYYNSPYAFSENKVTNHIELEGLEAALPEYLWKEEGKKAEQAVNEFFNKTGETVKNIPGNLSNGIQSGLQAIGSFLSKAINLNGTEGGYTLNSENGGVTGGSDKGVREGQGDGMLEVGHLLTPDTRSDAINLVQGFEEETNVIENSIKPEQKPNGKVTVQGPLSQKGYTTKGSTQINDSMRIDRTWVSDGEGTYTRTKIDTIKIDKDER